MGPQWTRPLTVFHIPTQKYALFTALELHSLKLLRFPTDSARFVPLRFVSECCTFWTLSLLLFPRPLYKNLHALQTSSSHLIFVVFTESRRNFVGLPGTGRASCTQFRGPAMYWTCVMHAISWACQVLEMCKSPTRNARERNMQNLLENAIVSGHVAQVLQIARISVLECEKH